MHLPLVATHLKTLAVTRIAGPLGGGDPQS
jgi:hypothetical protein